VQSPCAYRCRHEKTCPNWPLSPSTRPEKAMSQFWTRTEYEREKRNFIETRLRFRSVYFYSAVIFSVTWLSG
jgi:hypothetical protein